MPDDSNPATTIAISTSEAIGGHWGAPTHSFALAEAEARGLRCARTVHGPIERRRLDELAAHADVAVLAQWRGGSDDDRESVVLAHGGCVARVVVMNDGQAHLTAHGATPADTDTGAIAIARLLSGEELAAGAEPPTVVRTWYFDRYRGVSAQRTITPLNRETLLEGLCPSARTTIVELLAAGPSSGGVHVWHGKPGCGKTSTVRTLALEWREEATIEVVLDPASFLGNQDYMLQVLRAPEPAMTIADAARRMSRRATTRRVVVLEDAGELVAASTPMRAGQGISSMLNLTDGMLGEEHQPIVVITTNEHVGKLHPAVTRPGRCRSVVQFEPLDVEHAREWLDARGIESDVIVRPTSIAELVAIAGDSSPLRSGTEHEQLGFRVGA